MKKIYAYFDSMAAARKAQKELNTLGHAGVHLDMAGSYDYEFASELSLADTEIAPSLMPFVAGSGGRLFDTARAPIVAAGNAYGAECAEDCRDISAKLAMSVEEDDLKEVQRLIAENGGRILQ